MYKNGLAFYSEDDYLQLSGIQHFEFCPRQWALIHVEKQWSDNFFTAEGNIIHEKAHNPFFAEKRKGIIVSRAMPIHSARLGISGECDIVEFTQADSGITLKNREGKWKVCPVEYKRGEMKLEAHDRVQLAAQVICLEEMLVCEIPAACLYYDSIRRREYVEITEQLRKKVEDDLSEMHRYQLSGYTPRVKKTQKCSSCSLADICLPRLFACTSPSEYIRGHLNEKTT